MLSHKLRASARYLYHLAAGGWMLMIFLLSAIPGIELPGTEYETDKFVHMGLFGGLAFLLYRASSSKTPMSASKLVAVFFISAGFGLADEIHQVFVKGRDPTGWDLLADCIGVLLALAVLTWQERQARIRRAVGRQASP